MDGKTVLLFVAVIAVGMFVLPSTLALYTGQHDFVNGSSVECEKCHGSVKGDGTIGGELLNSSPDAHGDGSMDCRSCHTSVQAGANSSGNMSTTYTASHVHAAGININCIGCHSDETYINSSVETKDGYVNISEEMELSSEAHKFIAVNSSADNGGITDKDLICVACHTRVQVTMFNASNATTPDSGNIVIDGGSGNGEWTW